MVTYVNDLRLSELATGEGSGTWGTTTNTNLELIGEALGYGTEAITTNADTHATTVADGSTDPGRSMYIKYTGTLDSACTITIGPNTLSRVHIIENATSGSQNIIIKQGSGAEVTIPNGFVKAVYLDGAGSGAAVTEAFTDLSVGGNLLIDGATPTLTIGDAGAEDTKIVFDGNAQDFYIGLDDSTDDLVFGKGSTLGTTQAMAIDENMDVAFGPTTNVTITNDGNEDTLRLVSTDTDANAGPVLDFNRPVTGADDDVIGKITFSALDDGNNAVDYAYIETHIKDASDTAEDGLLDFQVMSAGTSRSFLILNGGGTVIVNQDSQDIDFRVESANNANMLFVDAGNDAVAIGHNASIAIAGESHELQVYDTNFSLISAATFRNGSDGANLTLAHSRSGTIGTQTILNDGDTMGGINFMGSDGTDMASYGARIFVEVDGTPGSNDMPGRIILATTPDGATGSIERVRIQNSGVTQFKTGDGNSGIVEFHTNASSGNATAYISHRPQGTAVGYLGNGSSLLSGAANSDFILRSEANLVFNANGNNEWVRINNNGSVSVGTSLEGGAIANGNPVTAGRFRTFTDVVGAANNTATTMVGLTTQFATYIACAGFNGVGNTNLYGASAIIHSDGTSHTLTHLVNPSNMTLSMSGSNVQATQTSGATLNISFSIIRIQ